MKHYSGGRKSVFRPPVFYFANYLSLPKTLSGAKIEENRVSEWRSGSRLAVVQNVFHPDLVENRP